MFKDLAHHRGQTAQRLQLGFVTAQFGAVGQFAVNQKECDFLEFAGVSDVENVVTAVVEVVAAATDGAQCSAAGRHAGQGDGFFRFSGDGCVVTHGLLLRDNKKSGRCIAAGSAWFGAYARLAEQAQHAIAFFLQFLQSGFHARHAEFALLQALDDLVFAVLAGHGEAVNDAFGDAVAAIGRNAHADPGAGFGALDPVADVVDRRVGSAGCRGQAARLNDGRAAFLDGRDEIVFEPGLVVDHRPDFFAAGGGVEHIGVLRGRVVAPDREFLDVGDGFADFLGDLRQCAIVVEAHHRREVRRLEFGRIFHGDQAVGVGRIADHQYFDAAFGDFGQRFTLRGENFSVGFEQILAFHAGATGAGADQQGDVSVSKSDHRIGSLHHALQQREGAVVEFHHHALQGFLRALVGYFQQLKDYRLVLAEHFAAGDAEQQAVADLAGSARHCYAHGSFHLEAPEFPGFLRFGGGRSEATRVAAHTGADSADDSERGELRSTQ